MICLLPVAGLSQSWFLQIPDNGNTFHPTDPQTFYVGAPAVGLWRTTDGGELWEPLTDNLPTLGISDIDLHPANPEKVVIGR